uniref:CSON005896 protein n=1 Tax=Culicoides sonorensis TaxID=179676 RepID=A0A336MR90_CULSO
MIKSSMHLLQIFAIIWIVLHFCSGDKFIDATSSNPTTTTIGSRLKQSEIDFLLNVLFNRYNNNNNKNSLSSQFSSPSTTKSIKNYQFLNKFANMIKNNNNNLMSNDVTNSDENSIAKYILKRAFVPPLANALSKSEMSALHDELNYLRNKVMDEVKKAKIRRSEKQEMDEKFVPSISVGALANLQGFFETLGQNLENIEEKKIPLDQLKFLERDRGLEHHVQKEIFEDPSNGSFGGTAATKPTGSAAFLHAIRNYRPAHKIRSLVSLHPEGYFQTNFHDPYYLHAGICLEN